MEIGVSGVLGLHAPLLVEPGSEKDTENVIIRELKVTENTALKTEVVVKRVEVVILE